MSAYAFSFVVLVVVSFTIIVILRREIGALQRTVDELQCRLSKQVVVVPEAKTNRPVNEHEIDPRPSAPFSGSLDALPEGAPRTRIITQIWIRGKKEPSVPPGYIAEQWRTDGENKTRDGERIPSGDLRWSEDGLELYAGDRIICPAPWRTEMKARARLREHIRILEIRVASALYISSDSTESYKKMCREHASESATELSVATSMLAALTEHPKDTYHALEQDRLATIVVDTWTRGGIDAMIRRLAAGGFPLAEVCK